MVVAAGGGWQGRGQTLREAEGRSGQLLSFTYKFEPRARRAVDGKSRPAVGTHRARHRLDVLHETGVNFGLPRFGREDAVLFIVTVGVALAYGIAHDHVTATLSPEYFLAGKNLASDPRPFRWAVTALAANASWPLGVLGGMAFRFANEPSERLPQRLPLRRLLGFVAVPVVTAAVGALVLGVLPIGWDPWKQRAVAEVLAGAERAPAFVRVWRVHIGSYVGGALGLILAVGLVRRRRARGGPALERG